ncbi:hypothetical protein HORIV_27560 [Vreelandella olivaria]|uniref:Uncharacterized protein n=1 Tax=Vreelandella olivaria TaxID=390919 RepID=A0ABM7GE14_9GAMM|nr:hypothetical protein HORIV_27560 [Halomonas olivaria]
MCVVEKMDHLLGHRTLLTSPPYVGVTKIYGLVTRGTGASRFSGNRCAAKPSFSTNRWVLPDFVEKYTNVPTTGVGAQLASIWMTYASA